MTGFVRLGDVVNINPRGVPNLELTDDIAFVAMADVTEEGVLHTSRTRSYAEVSAGYTPFQGGDVLLAKITPCFENGKSCLVPEISPLYGFGSTEFHVLRAGCAIDSRFLHHLVRSPKFRSEGRRRMTGSAGQKRVPTSFISDYRVVLPPIAEQRCIAAILDKADDVRKKRREALKLAEEFLHSVYLGAVKSALNVDSPAFSLLDILNVTTGKLDSNAAEDGGEYPFFTCAQETSRINSYAFEGEALLLAGNNASGDYSVKHYKGKFNAYQRTYVLSLKNERYSYGFFRYAVESKLRDLKRMSKGTNTKYLTMGILAEQMLVVPDEEIQQRFTIAYRKVDNLKQSMHRHLALANDLFSSLANRAFSGQL